MKFWQLNQKLWPREISWHALHGLQDISTVLTSILTHELSMENEFNNLHNDAGLNLFRLSDQN